MGKFGKRIRERIRDRLHSQDVEHDDPIKHVVVLMFENHSFDQMLGCFNGVDGVDPANPRSNKDSAGREYFQRESDNPIVTLDPKHELEHILNQLKDGNSGFVSEYEKEYLGKNPDLQRIMDYFGMGKLPALHELANHFTICDRWFSSVPGPTWTNRFFVHSGTSKGRVRMFGGGEYNPVLFLGYDQDTIYDRLSDKGIEWNIYQGDVPQSLMLENQQSDEHRHRYKWLDEFFDDAQGREVDFPEYAFIEPRYFHFPFEQSQNDDHPPHSTIPAQELLADVYNAIRANSVLWNSTLLVVVYDENGGFYDHVPPPDAVPPDEHHVEYDFKQLGVRVPALLISPWVDHRVLSTQFDHTSLLKYLTDKWHLQPLTKRVEAATSIREAISIVGEPRTDTPKAAPKPMKAMTAAAPSEVLHEEEFNDLQLSLIEFSKHLEAKTPPQARRPMMAAGSESEAQKARQRVQAFLRHGNADSTPQ